MSSTIDGVRIVDMPDLGAFNDTSSVVGERAGSGRFGAPGLSGYFATRTYVDGQFPTKGYVDGQDGMRPYIVATIAALRALTTAVTAAAAWVQGYGAPADRGDGMFCYVSTDTTSADNGGTIIVDASGRRWYRATQGGPYSATWFGLSESTVDNGAVINAAIAALPANGGVIRLPPGNFNVASTILINRSNIRIVGSGRGGWHDAAPFFTTGATNLTWTGANGGTMISITSVAGGQRVVGCEISDVSLVAGVLPFASAANTGILCQSVAFSKFHLYTAEFSNIHLDFQVLAGALSEPDSNNESNEISLVFRALSNPAVTTTQGAVLRFAGRNGVGNSAMNHVSYLGGQYLNGEVLEIADGDNNRIDFFAPYRAPGGAGSAAVFRGQRGAGNGFARQNVIYWMTEQTGGGPIIVEGTDTAGVTQASIQNGIVFFDYGDDTPGINDGVGARFWYGNNTMPVATDFWNFSAATLSGAVVDTGRIGNVWGKTDVAVAGSVVVPVNASGNSPVVGVQNVQITPGQSSAAYWADTYTLNSFTLHVGTVGTYYWRAMVI